MAGLRAESGASEPVADESARALFRSAPGERVDPVALAKELEHLG